ncbi:MAG: serine/threonine-protein kinase [Myxococcota bacterium]
MEYRPGVARARAPSAVNQGTPYGRYELLRKIAAGGMAEIFVGRQRGQGGFFRDVVIKRLFKNFVEHEPTLRMFHYEAHLLAHLSHPNIPQVYDLGFANGTWFLAMEFVDGWNLADLWRMGVRARQVMPLHVTVGIVLQVCEALNHAHLARDRAGRPLRIVHRDVTPQNVMITRDGVAKLMDFGVAKTDARPATEAGAVKGTFSYMAPEQVRGRTVDRRADVFALGVILHELTTGSRLFRGSEVQVMTAIVEQDAPPPSARVPDYPADLEEIVLAALRRDRRSRIASTSDLALHLEHFAMRHALLVGPRAIAHYVREVVPGERLVEEELALVPEVSTASGELPLQPPPEPPTDEHFAEDVSADAMLVDDVDDLEDLTGGSEDVDLDPELVPLEGFGDEPLSGDRPVVLLDKAKPQSEHPDAGGGYLEDLMRRLEADDDES